MYIVFVTYVETETTTTARPAFEKTPIITGTSTLKAFYEAFAVKVRKVFIRNTTVGNSLRSGFDIFFIKFVMNPPVLRSLATTPSAYVKASTSTVGITVPKFLGTEP